MERLIQITAGRGPQECQWVVARVLKIFLEQAESNLLRYKVIHRTEGDLSRTLKSATILLEDITPERLDRFIRSWTGTIRWIGRSEVRTMHKRNNWFIGIFEVEHLAIPDFRQSDIRFQAVRSQGNGGQHVNKVSTAIRATHIPTGCAVFVQDSRSQYENKQTAIERLREKIKTHQLAEIENQMQDTWLQQIQVQRGNPIKTFKDTDFKTFFEDKSYKKKRLQLKLNLKNYVYGPDTE